MSKYSLILSSFIPSSTKIKVWELCKNGKSIFQSFVDEIESDKILFRKLSSAIRIIENSSNLINIAPGKFKQIKKIKSFKVFEAKSDIIRVYLFHENKNGRVIVIGGKKDNQKEDINLVTKIIKDYYNEKTNK